MYPWSGVGSGQGVSSVPLLIVNHTERLRFALLILVGGRQGIGFVLLHLRGSTERIGFVLLVGCW
ncbi:MAG: hypothetical protein U0175_05075 [Caldilineaceae bacterium]